MGKGFQLVGFSYGMTKLDAQVNSVLTFNEIDKETDQYAIKSGYYYDKKTKLAREFDKKRISKGAILSFFVLCGVKYFLVNYKRVTSPYGAMNGLISWGCYCHYRLEQEHARSEETADLEFEVDVKTDDKKIQRGREQQIHDEFRPPLNKIKPISDKNRKKRRIYEVCGRLYEGYAKIERIMKREKFSEGTIFSVPLSSSHIAIGLVIRINKNILYGWFLDEKVSENHPIDDLYKMFYDDSKIFLKKKFGIAGLNKGRWKVLGQLPDWDSRKWPVPKFRRQEPISGRYFISYYNDKLEMEREELVEYSAEILDYPEDGTAGYGWIEKRLSRLID